MPKYGKVLPLLRGAYDNAVAYKILDIVTYTDGCSYIAKQDTVGHLPTETDYWQLHGRQGEKGDRGEKGDKGDTGSGASVAAEVTYIDNNGIGGTDLQTVVDLVVDKTDDLSSALSGFVSKTTFYDFDGQGNDREVGDSGTLITYYNYDGNGNDKEIFTDLNGRSISKITTYDFDGNGNDREDVKEGAN